MSHDNAYHQLGWVLANSIWPKNNKYKQMKKVFFELPGCGSIGHGMQKIRKMMASRKAVWRSCTMAKRGPGRR